MNDKVRTINIDGIEVQTSLTPLELADLSQKYAELQSNWNSLRECIIGVIEGAREELNTIIHTTDSFTYANQCSRKFDVIRKSLKIVLDKMNELEGGEDENN